VANEVVLEVQFTGRRLCAIEMVVETIEMIRKPFEHLDIYLLIFSCMDLVQYCLPLRHPSLRDSARNH
jgi:hypothetical protein